MVGYKINPPSRIFFIAKLVWDVEWCINLALKTYQIKILIVYLTGD